MLNLNQPQAVLSSARTAFLAATHSVWADRLTKAFEGVVQAIGRGSHRALRFPFQCEIYLLQFPKCGRKSFPKGNNRMFSLGRHCLFETQCLQVPSVLFSGHNMNPSLITIQLYHSFLLTSGSCYFAGSITVSLKQWVLAI